LLTVPPPSEARFLITTSRIFEWQDDVIRTAGGESSQSELMLFKLAEEC
jgi:hypothetical protein